MQGGSYQGICTTYVSWDFWLSGIIGWSVMGRDASAAEYRWRCPCPCSTESTDHRESAWSSAVCCWTRASITVYTAPAAPLPLYPHSLFPYRQMENLCPGELPPALARLVTQPYTPSDTALSAHPAYLRACYGRGPTHGKMRCVSAVRLNG